MEKKKSDVQKTKTIQGRILQQVTAQDLLDFAEQAQNMNPALEEGGD